MDGCRRRAGTGGSSRREGKRKMRIGILKYMVHLRGSVETQCSVNFLEPMKVPLGRKVQMGKCNLDRLWSNM